MHQVDGSKSYVPQKKGAEAPSCLDSETTSHGGRSEVPAVGFGSVPGEVSPGASAGHSFTSHDSYLGLNCFFTGPCTLGL